MIVTCFECNGIGLIPVGRNETLRCDECGGIGEREIEPRPPFSIEAICGDETTDNAVRARFIDSGLSSLTEAEANADLYAHGASILFHGWDFFVSDANGERVKKTRCLAELAAE